MFAWVYVCSVGGSGPANMYQIELDRCHTKPPPLFPSENDDILNICGSASLSQGITFCHNQFALGSAAAAVPSSSRATASRSAIMRFRSAPEPVACCVRSSGCEICASTAWTAASPFLALSSEK